MSERPLTLDDRLLVPSSVISRDLDGEMVMLNLETGIYFGLDTVGAAMWTHIQALGRLTDVRDRIVVEFDVTPAVATTDLLRLAEDLRARGLVEIAPTA